MKHVVLEGRVFDGVCGPIVRAGADVCWGMVEQYRKGRMQQRQIPVSDHGARHFVHPFEKERPLVQSVENAVRLDEDCSKEPPRPPYAGQEVEIEYQKFPIYAVLLVEEILRVHVRRSRVVDVRLNFLNDMVDYPKWDLISVTEYSDL